MSHIHSSIIIIISVLFPCDVRIFCFSSREFPLTLPLLPSNSCSISRETQPYRMGIYLHKEQGSHRIHNNFPVRLKYQFVSSYYCFPVRRVRVFYSFVLFMSANSGNLPKQILQRLSLKTLFITIFAVYRSPTRILHTVRFGLSLVRCSVLLRALPLIFG